MPTLQEILDDIDSWVPGNEVTTAKKVKWLNNIQRQLFRDFNLPDAVDKFTTVAGVAVYPLPDLCAEDRITEITVGGTEYDYQTLDEEAKDKFWAVVQGQLMIYPTPESAVDVFIYHRPRPNQLSESSLSAVPTFPEDYHDLLMFTCAERVAAAHRDFELASLMADKAKELRTDANKKFGKKMPSTVTVERAASDE